MCSNCEMENREPTWTLTLAKDAFSSLSLQTRLLRTVEAAENNEDLTGISQNLYPLQYWKELWVSFYLILGYPSWVLHKMLLQIRDDLTCQTGVQDSTASNASSSTKKMHRQYVTILPLEMLLSKIYIIPSCLPNSLKEQYNFHQFPINLISLLISWHWRAFERKNIILSQF